MLQTVSGPNFSGAGLNDLLPCDVDVCTPWADVAVDQSVTRRETMVYCIFLNLRLRLPQLAVKV